ncbi:MAG: restriction endonuclease subunit S [Cyanobacteriota bacterium]|jgi:type I restriction enzyme S subunit
MNHPQVPLGEVADFVNGAAFKPEDWVDDGLPIIRIQNLTDSDKPFNYTERIVPEKLVVNPGDLLVSWSATLGVFQWNGPKGLLNQHIFRVLPNDEVVDKNYLKHTLGQAINDMERHLHGATMKHVNRGEFLGTRIPLPPLEEQQRIAAILDKTIELSSANRQRKDLLRALPLSVYRQMLGDPRHNPFQWPVFRLGEICLNEDARRVPVKSSDRKAMQGRYPYYGASGVIDHVDDYLFDGQRLLVGEDGANLIARSYPIAFIADGKYWVNNHAHVLSENGKAKLRFLEYYFALVDLKPFVTGSAQPKLTRSALDSLPIPLPPLDLQERFESVLTALNAREALANTPSYTQKRLNCSI